MLMEVPTCKSKKPRELGFHYEQPESMDDNLFSNLGGKFQQLNGEQE